MVRVWSLYRVSTDRQGSEGEENIPVQKNACTNFAKSRGWTITHEISEKLSGFRTPIDERQSIYEIAEGAKNGEFDVLLVQHSDRIGRQIEYSLFITSLYEKGIEVWSVLEGELRAEKHEDGLINYIRFWNSEGESRKTSEKVREGMRQMNEAGEYVGGTPAYGYKIEDTGEKRNSKSSKTIKIQVIDEEEAEVVKKIFYLVLNKNYGASRIAQYLNDLGLKNRGKIWRHNTISRMLRNPIYMGKKRYNTIRNANTKTNQKISIPREEWKLQPFNKELQIISEEDFKRVQRIIDKRKVRRGRNVSLASNVLLSGLIECGYCGSNLATNYKYNYYTKQDGTTSKYKSYSYRCHMVKNITDEVINHEQKVYGSKTIDKHVEEEVLNAISRLKVETLNEEKDLFDVRELDSRTNRLKQLEQEYKQVETAYNNTVNLFDDVMMGKSTMKLEFVQERLDRFGTKKRQIETELKELKKELKEAELDSLDLDDLKKQLNTWVETYKNTALLDEKKAMLNQVLKKIVVKKDTIMLKFHIAIENALLKEVDSKKLMVRSDSDSQRGGGVNTPLRYMDKNIDFKELLKQWKAINTIEFEHKIVRETV